MRKPSRAALAAGAVAASVLPLAAIASPAAALEGDEYASVSWTQTFARQQGGNVSCSLFAEAGVDPEDGGFSAFVRFRVEDDDADCQEPIVRLGILSTDASGDPQESRSTSSGPRAALTVTDVAADVRATVSVAYPICRPPSPGCGSFHELQPKSDLGATRTGGQPPTPPGPGLLCTLGSTPRNGACTVHRAFPPAAAAAPRHRPPTSG